MLTTKQSIDNTVSNIDFSCKYIHLSGMGPMMMVEMEKGVLLHHLLRLLFYHFLRLLFAGKAGKQILKVYDAVDYCWEVVVLHLVMIVAAEENFWDPTNSRLPHIHIDAMKLPMLLQLALAAAVVEHQCIDHDDEMEEVVDEGHHTPN